MLTMLCLLPACNNNAPEKTPVNTASQTVSPTSVSLDEAQSWLEDFSVDGNSVRIFGRLCLKNSTGEAVSVRIYGNFEEDAGRLLREALLPACEQDKPEQTVFSLQPGENILAVSFIGTFAGTAQKQDRLLPEILIVPAE